jgi:putative addiction module component (TIGR02574 family)
MNLSVAMPEILSLSIDERLSLAEAIWDSILSEPGQPELTDAQRLELERRLEAHAASPESVTPWEEVKREALQRAGR